MAVNKNFVVKNGLEVNTDLLFADSATRSVGVGSTSPNFDLDVRGGIGATDLRVTGFTTLTKDFQVGASGSAFYVSNTNNLVGVGTSVPAFLMDIRSSVSTGQTALYVKGDMRVTGDINLDDLTIDDLTVTGIATYKPDGSGGSPDSWIDIDYTGNTTTGGGTTVGFGSTAYFVDEAKVVFGAGEDLTIGHVGGLNVIGGAVKFSDATQSSSKDTGSVILEGGAGIEKNLFVGGGASITGIATVGTALTLPDNIPARFGTAGDLVIKHFGGGNSYISDITNDVVIQTGQLRVVNAADNANLAAFTQGGSAQLYFNGVQKIATTQGGVIVAGGSSVSGIITTTDATQSSSSTTGSLQVAGGAGIAKNLYVGGGASITGITSIYANGNNYAAFIENPHATGNGLRIRAGDADGDRPLLVEDKGAVNLFAVYGGGGVDINVGVVTARNTTQSSSSTNGAFQIKGGASVSKNLFVGGGAHVGSAFTINSGIGVTIILDEDDMASNSASALASQQSIKAYVDTQITAEDLDFSGDSGTGAVDLDSQTLAISGTASEIKTVASGQSLTISLPDDIIVGNGLTVTGIGSFLNDVNFRGKSGLTSAFWDKSESSLKWNDGAKAEFGDSQDLSIYHTGAESHIQETGTGGLILNSSVTTIKNAGDSETIARFTENGGVDLNFDNSTKFATGPAGVIVTGVTTADGFSVGDNEYITAGVGSDFAVYHTGSHSYLENDTGSLFVQSNNQIYFQDTSGNRYADFVDGGAVKLYYNNAAENKRFETGPAGTITVGFSTADGFHVGDGAADGDRISIGDSNDLALYHNASNSFIVDRGTGPLYIRGNTAVRIESYTNDAAGEPMIIANSDSSVDIYYDNVVKFSTSGVGATVYGTGALNIPVGTTAERPTLGNSPVNGDIRYNTTLNSYEGYGNGAWGGLGGGTEIDNTIATTTATGISTFVKTDYRSAYFRLQITQGSAYQVGRYLLIHDGTTATLIEESAIATGSMLGDVTAAVSGSNVIIYINMGSSSSATVTHIIDKITV